MAHEREQGGTKGGEARGLRPPLPGLRQRMSSALNTFLHQFGYALVRLGPPTKIAQGNHDYAYENILIPDALAPWATDGAFVGLWTEIHGHTLTDVYRCHELYQLVREVAHIPGDILEVGVWRGGTGAVLAAAASTWKPTARIWLCDTFSGVVKAGSLDPSYVGGEHADTSPQAVKSLINRLNLDNVEILAGIFPDETGSLLNSDRIALCHIDVDVYRSAADIVTWVLPRMERGAMIVFDDYGFSSCKGITRLVDELRTDGHGQYFYNLHKHAILVKR